MQKYQKGDRVKVLVGHPMWSTKGGWLDINPELTEDAGTIEYTYGQMSEIDSRYSTGEQGYRQYCINFDKHGSISWFDEENIVLEKIVEENAITN